MEEEHPQPDPPQEPPVLSYQTPGRPMSWVVVQSYATEMEAALACGRLDAEGIGTQLNRGGLTVYTGSGQFDVSVLEDDVARAQKLLQEIEAALRKRRQAADAALNCPKCGAGGTSGYDRRILFLAVFLMAAGALSIAADFFGLGVLLLFLGGIGIAIAIQRRTCRTCGKTFSPAKHQGDDADES